MNFLFQVKRVVEEMHINEALRELRGAKAVENISISKLALSKESEEARKARAEELERRKSLDLLRVRKVFFTEQRQNLWTTNTPCTIHSTLFPGGNMPQDEGEGGGGGEGVRLR